MNIITLVTKRSVRETERHLRYKKYYSSATYTPGEMIEIIDGRRKSPAIVLKAENASAYKQEIRDGSLVAEKMQLSKTGEHKDGIVIESFSIQDIKQYLKDPSLVHQTGNTNLTTFFPKKRTQKSASKISATKDGSLSTLSLDRYSNQTKTHSTELQLFVDEVRTYFNEKARYGQGSFSYYLGFCKKIPLQDLWQMFGEAKQAKNKTRFEQKKLFWWKIGQYIKK